jgi:putative NADH-flavin reductase
VPARARAVEDRNLEELVMKIVLFGATGMIGSRIAAEAVRRGHRVVAVSRSGRAPLDDPQLNAVAADAGSAGTVAGLVRGADAVASALVPLRSPRCTTPSSTGCAPAGSPGW